MAAALPRPSKCPGENTEALRLERMERRIETSIGWDVVFIFNCHKNCLVFVTLTSQFKPQCAIGLDSSFVLRSAMRPILFRLSRRIRSNRSRLCFGLRQQVEQAEAQC